ncbi:unnamed protein product [Phaeothamnion confervicola]
MKIRDILASKPWRSIVSVRPDKPVTAIPALFDENNISSVLVVDAHGHLHGIVTDRNFLSAMARNGKRFFEQPVSSIMQSPAPTCVDSDAVTDAMRRMTQDRIRHLVVLDDDHVAGIVSIGDLVKSRLNEIEMESRVLRDMALGRLSAV